MAFNTQNYAEISESPLNVNAAIEKVSLPSCGAMSIFIGTTKDKFDGKKVIELQYTAYQAMAIKEMHKIMEEGQNKWLSVERMAVVHRIGVVAVGEASIIVAASSEHRDAAQEAVKWTLDRVKSTVPVWKKEIYEDSSCWKENKECFWMK